MVKTVSFGSRDIVRMGIGTNRLRNSSEHVKFITDAIDAGVELIDTARKYTDGLSELAIGEAFGDRPGTAAFVSTKGGGAREPGAGRPESIASELEQSLQSLRTDVIPLYYLHRVDPTVPLEESLAPIKRYQIEGRITHVGISNVGVNEVERARRVAPIAAVQCEYNLTARENDPVVDYCERENLIFVAYFPLHFETRAAVLEVAAKHRATANQIGLAWMLKRSPAIMPIPGTLSIDHVRENLAALRINLSSAEYELLSE